MGQDVNTRGELKPTEPHPTAHFAKIWKDMNTTEKPTGKRFDITLVVGFT